VERAKALAGIARKEEMIWSKNHTNEESQDNHEQLNHELDARNLETDSAANSLSRRSFLGRAGASTVAVAAASVGLPAMLSENAEGQIAEQTARSDRSFQIRLNAATRESKVHIPPQLNNGDEARYANFNRQLLPGSTPQQHR
jgi:hypothetical protein